MLNELRKVFSAPELHNYSFDFIEDETGLLVAVVSYGNVRVGKIGKVYPCDTTIYDEPEQAGGEVLIGFATVIHPGTSGSYNEEFDKVIEVLNYEFPGKFVRDYTDESQDVLYSTRVHTSRFTGSVVVEQLEHHGQVKGFVTPELEHLKTQLGLEEKTLASEAEQFAFDWARTFKRVKELSWGRKITLLPKGRR